MRLAISNSTLFLIVLFVALSIPGCSEFFYDNDCDDCQKAIDHMFDKIDANGCDPDFMENAVNRIKDECDAHLAAEFVGFMAETCSRGEKEAAICGTRQSTFKMGLLVKRSVLSPDSVDIQIVRQHATKPTAEFTLGPGDSKSIADEQTSYGEGDTFFFTIIGKTAGNEDTTFLSKTKNFTYVRPGNYHRTRVVNFDYIDGEHSITFENWE